MLGKTRIKKVARKLNKVLRSVCSLKKRKFDKNSLEVLD